MVWGVIILFTVVIPAVIIWVGKILTEKYAEAGDSDRGTSEGYRKMDQSRYWEVYTYTTETERKAERGKRERTGCLLFAVLPLAVYAIAMIAWVGSR